MLSELQQKVLNKFVETLNANNIPYFIDGGLAAIAWGSKRPLVDIDVVVPKANIRQVRNLFEKNIMHDAQNYKSEHWDIWQTSLEIDGVTIEVCQAEDFYILSNGQRMEFDPDVSRGIPKQVAGLTINVQPKEELIKIKKFLSREVDHADLEYLEKTK